jgi:hypothetical protein
MVILKKKIEMAPIFSKQIIVCTCKSALENFKRLKALLKGQSGFVYVVNGTTF